MEEVHKGWIIGTYAIKDHLESREKVDIPYQEEMRRLLDYFGFSQVPHEHVSRMDQVEMQKILKKKGWKKTNLGYSSFFDDFTKEGEHLIVHYTAKDVGKFVKEKHDFDFEMTFLNDDNVYAIKKFYRSEKMVRLVQNESRLSNPLMCITIATKLLFYASRGYLPVLPFALNWEFFQFNFLKACISLCEDKQDCIFVQKYVSGFLQQGENDYQDTLVEGYWRDLIRRYFTFEEAVRNDINFPPSFYGESSSDDDSTAPERQGQGMTLFEKFFFSFMMTVAMAVLLLRINS